MRPTAAQVDEALRANATHVGDTWVFSSGYAHDDESARAFVGACLILGVRVNDTLTGEAWGAMANRVADLEDRIAAMETRTR